MSEEKKDMPKEFFVVIANDGALPYLGRLEFVPICGKYSNIDGKMYHVLDSDGDGGIVLAPDVGQKEAYFGALDVLLKQRNMFLRETDCYSHPANIFREEKEAIKVSLLCLGKLEEKITETKNKLFLKI